MELYHSGVKNMRWGHRRYQNPDGSLTPLGRAHYGVGQARTATSRGIEEAKQAGTRIGGELSSGRVSATGTRASNLGETGSGLGRKAGYKGNDMLEVGSFDSYERRRTREQYRTGKRVAERVIATHMDESIDFAIHRASDSKGVTWLEDQLGLRSDTGDRIRERRAQSMDMKNLLDTNLDDLREMEMRRYSGEGYTSSGGADKKRDYSYSTSGIRRSAGRKPYRPLRGSDTRW